MNQNSPPPIVRRPIRSALIEPKICTNEFEFDNASFQLLAILGRDSNWTKCAQHRSAQSCRSAQECQRLIAHGVPEQAIQEAVKEMRAAR
jgi:hypothetical protein